METVINVAEAIVGWATDHWLLLVTVGLPVTVFLTFVKMFIVAMRAYDLNWDKNACEAAEPRIDLRKGLRRFVGIPRLGLPMAVMSITLLELWIITQNWDVYWAAAIVWFMTAPLRKVWGIAIARRAYKRANPGYKPETSLLDDLLYYWEWGTQGKTARFTGRLAKWNWLRFFLVVIKFWKLWGIVAMAAASVVWPVFALFAPFFHTEQVDKYDYWHKPWWRMNRDAPKPPSKVVNSTAVETRPGTGKARPTQPVTE